MNSSLSQFLGQAIGICAKIGGCVIDKFSEVATCLNSSAWLSACARRSAAVFLNENISETVTVNISLSHSFGPAIDMCTLVGSCVVDKISEVVTVNSSLSQFLGLAIGKCTTVGGCVVDKTPLVVTVSSSLSQFFGLAIGMCATVGGCVIYKSAEVATVSSSLSQFLGLAIGMCATVIGCAIDKISKLARRGLGCADALKTRASADGKAVQWMKAVQWKADLNELREAMIQWLERALKQWQYSAG